MKLLVVDPFVAMRAPSMRSWIVALPAFRDLFTEIEIWATECDVPEGDGITWKRIPKRIPVMLFHMVEFQWRVTRMLHKKPVDKDTLVFTTGCNVANADIHYLHFWNRAMLEEQRKRKESFRLLPHHRMVASLIAVAEKSVTAARLPNRWWWSVSRSIAEKIHDEGASGEFRILPNPYDPERFSATVRNKWRAQMRELYGFRENEIVFVFSSFSHFERKGLPQCIEALSKLYSKGYPVRLLILGGTLQTLGKFKKKLKLQNLTTEFCLFAGLVTPIEHHLSAADALLFPSHFEAFSLAEIEAAALGIRLYLTPHYGSEMILREPVNGRLLPWDAEGMAKVIEADILDGTVGISHCEIGEAVTQKEYSEQIRILFEEVIASKHSQSESTSLPL